MRSGVDCLTAAAPSPSAAHDLLRKDPAPNLARRRLVLPAASREPQGAPRLRSTKPTTPAIGTPRRHPPDLGHRAERQIAALRRPSGLRRRETRKLYRAAAAGRLCGHLPGLSDCWRVGHGAKSSCRLRVARATRPASPPRRAETACGVGHGAHLVSRRRPHVALERARGGAELRRRHGSSDMPRLGRPAAAPQMLI